MKKAELLNEIDDAYMDALWIGRLLSERWQGVTDEGGDDVWAMLSAYFDLIEARFEKMRNKVTNMIEDDEN